MSKDLTEKTGDTALEAVYSTETLSELHEMGLEPEDILALDKSRGGFQKMVLSVVGNVDEKKVIALANRVKAEEVAYMEKVKTALEQKFAEIASIERPLISDPDYYFDLYVAYCGESLERWKFVEENILGLDGTLAIYAIGLTRDFGDDLDKFKQAVKIVDDTRMFLLTEEKGSISEVEAFERGLCRPLSHLDPYDGDIEILEIFSDLVKKTVPNYFLTELHRDKYKHNYSKEFLRICARIIKTDDLSWGPKSVMGGRERFRIFQKARPIYESNLETASDVADICTMDDLNQGIRARIEVLLENLHAFKGNEPRTKAFLQLGKFGSKASNINAVRLLAKMEAGYGDNDEDFEDIFKIISELCYITGDTGKEEIVADSNNARLILSLLEGNEKFSGLGKEELLKAVETLMSIIKCCPEDLRDVFEKEGLFSTFDLTDGDVLKNCANVSLRANEVYHDSCEAVLLRLKALYAGDIVAYEEVVDVLCEAGKQFGRREVEVLSMFADLFGNDISRFKIAVKYCGHSKYFDGKVLGKFIDITQGEGEEAAREYLESLRGKAKGLVSSAVPEKNRAMAEYQYLVRYVFPSGNYSTHEKNLACGDKLEHVSKYKFDRNGYPVMLSGVRGYRLKAGAEVDDSLLDEYSGRLSKVRNFVESRGPDNKALQEAFGKNVDAIFEEKAWPEFKGLSDLNLKEKMLCLLVAEAFRRKQRGQASEPDSDICDLVVEYKYAFHEDLEAYVARSADTVKSFSDDLSQNYMLLAELSVIYGENIKHVLRHNIFEDLEESDNFDRIVEIFSEKSDVGGETRDLTEKQWSRVNNTFSNPHIPEGGMMVNEKYKPGKKEVLYKQFYGIFSSNIEFESDEQRQEFDSKLKAIFDKVEADFSIEKIKELLPEFFKLRSLYRSGINAKLTELFSYDINRIFAELAKYEENIEVEAKERSMGGPKTKMSGKSSKKRHVRGFFTKTAETANARMGAYLCLADDSRMWENKNYFEFVMVDEETNKCVGLTMLLSIKAKDGKKYLWFGPNPFESFLDVVSSKACYDYLYDRVCEFAKENGFEGVVVPSKDEQILGQCTNRGGDFPGFIKASRLRNKSGELMVVDFGGKHDLGSGYGYENGALIWRNAQK